MTNRRPYLQTPPSPIVPQIATPPAVPQENPLGVRRLLWENGFSRGILTASIEVGRRVPGSYGISLGVRQPIFVPDGDHRSPGVSNVTCYSCDASPPQFERWDNASHCRAFKRFLQPTADLVMYEKAVPHRATRSVRLIAPCIPCVAYDADRIFLSPLRRAWMCRCAFFLPAVIFLFFTPLRPSRSHTLMAFCTMFARIVCTISLYHCGPVSIRTVDLFVLGFLSGGSSTQISVIVVAL